MSTMHTVYGLVKFILYKNTILQLHSYTGVPITANI